MLVDGEADALAEVLASAEALAESEGEGLAEELEFDELLELLPEEPPELAEELADALAEELALGSELALPEPEELESELPWDGRGVVGRNPMASISEGSTRMTRPGPASDKIPEMRSVRVVRLISDGVA